MKKIRKSIELHEDTYNRLKSFKGSKTFNELIGSWLDHFEGTTNSEDEIKYITSGDWDNLIQRIKQLETNQ